MTEYVYSPDVPYATYLEQGALAPDAAPGRREDTLVGAPGPAAPPGVAFERQEWHGGIEGVDFAFHWGAAECLLERGQFAAPIEALKSSSKTGAQIWTVDQFDAARDAFRHGLYRDSFDRVQAGLNGDQDQEADGKDYRALFLLGLLRLGSFNNGDPSLLDLAQAEEAFLRAGRHAAAVQPSDAAWAYTAGAWAAYCHGRMDDAVASVRAALALRTKFSEAQYLAAKIFMRQGRSDAAIPYLTAAIAIHPSFGRRAMRDADFAASAARVDQAIEGERLTVSQRASDALKAALKRAVEVGIVAADERTPIALPPGSGAGNAAALLIAARESATKNTLFGFFEAESLAALASGTLNAAVARSKSDMRSLEQAVRQTSKAIAQFAQLESGSRPLGAEVAQELRKAQAFLAATEPALTAATPRDFLMNYDPARVALAGALQALESCKRGAIEAAAAERAELEEKLNRSAKIENGGGGYVVKGLVVGFALALLPPMLTGGGSSILNGDRDAMFRFGILALAASAIGAVFGLLAGPLANSSAIAQRAEMESAKAQLEEIIDELRSVPLGRSGD